MIEGRELTELKVHSQHNCYRLSPEEMQRIEQEVSASIRLEIGTHMVQIRGGLFDYKHTSDKCKGEPFVMLWIYGLFKDLAVEQTVSSTWLTLNGYEDILTLEVFEPTTLCAFFFDTYAEDNRGEVKLSVTKLPSSVSSI